MNKPLKDWTLGEMQEECLSRAAAGVCDSCPIHNFCHQKYRSHIPMRWDLSDKPKFTPDELAVLRAAKNGGVEEVSANSPAGDYLYLYDGRNGYIGRFPSFLLPSLRYGQKVKLDRLEL